MSTSLATTGLLKVRRLLRIDFKNPKEDYLFVQEMPSNQGMLICHRKNRLHLAVIRESYSATPLPMLEQLAHVQHPNVADILDVYFHDGQLLIVGEHLDISLLELEFRKLPLEEWEMATIVAEVIKAMTYLLDTVPVCELLIDSVRLSLQGEVKLVPDLNYQKAQDESTGGNLYNSAFLAEILGFMMSQGPASDKGWSSEALEFASLPSSHSLEPFVRHVFLSKAVLPSKLIPRIRLATKMLGLPATSV